MTLNKIKQLQRANENLKQQIEAKTIQFVDNDGIAFDELLELNMQQADIENELVEMVACFQAIEYRPVFNGLAGLSI